MPVYAFPCPHCSAPLRLRDRRLVGRTIACPDCGQPVALRDGSDSAVAGSQVVRAIPAREHVRRVQKQHGGPHAIESRRPSAKWLAKAASPLGVAWIVAAGLSAGLLGWLIASLGADRSSRVYDSRNDSQRIVATDVSADGALPSAQAGEKRPVEERLHGLFDSLSIYHTETGSWPRGTAGSPALPDGSRFSWLAVLAARSDPAGPQPHWDRAWNDPLNERFVRRRQDPFLNPAIERQTGNDRYPASHFVGVTGVGVDSELLPDDHPRAGLFGNDRTTSPDDLTDGLANTMMVAGVDRRLGSWAASGSSTLRGFTTQPYVNGPDGFGTGQADGMCVLMADGSVRFLSAETDPAVIRRMAAKADGLPLDASAPERPATDHQPPEQVDAGQAAPADQAAAESSPESNINANPFEIAEVVAEIAGGAGQPIEVPFAEEADDGKNVDVAAALEQPIARFDQQAPVPARQLLQAIEEMAVVRMEFDRLPEPARKRLDEPVTVTLAETTVGEILEAVLGNLGLDYAVRGNRLSIFERKADE